jgi:hypothetical protein
MHDAVGEDVGDTTDTDSHKIETTQPASQLATFNIRYT